MIILEFEFLSKGLQKGNIQILSIENKKYLPHRLTLTDDGLRNWLKHRSIPKNREYVRELLSSMNLDENDTQGILSVTKGLSLNDAYWICNKDEEILFDNINLYDNDFSETLSLVAFTGYNTKIEALCSSPEFTTAGMLPKCWRRIDNELYLYKGGTANAGNEPYSEY